MLEKNYHITKVKLIRRILSDKNHKSITLKDHECDIMEEIKDYSEEELKREIENSIKKITQLSGRNKSPYMKRCIGKCNREYNVNGKTLEIYCSSCERVINTRPIKQNV